MLGPISESLGAHTGPRMLQRWSASDFAKNGQFIQDMAGPIFALLAPKPGERILDLGCGDGTLTAEIEAAGADVIGLDVSAELLAVARMKGLSVKRADAHDLDYVQEFDAVFSNAALHWMQDPALVIDGVARALRPGGRFVGELGGHGNIAAIATALRAVVKARGGDPAQAVPWYFPTMEEFGALLSGHGFVVREMALVPRSTPLKGDMHGWLGTFCRFFFDRFEEPERSHVLEEALDLLRPSLCDTQGRWTVNHIRLRFSAERGPS
ncbi:class I SAM-dependent methyltransferase [Methyloceanibacter caenitepidi]|nr:class I SAM-dependent methyltransferase [Methyloceanibacter caenitepidi]